MKKATFIRLKANPSKAEPLSAFLLAGRDLVAQTEPQTLLWFALANQVTADERAIFDVFEDQRGRELHFAGKVAAGLQEQAPSLVKGGWQQGVLENVANYDVLAAKAPSSGRKPVKCGNLIILTAAPGKSAALEKLLVSGRDLVASTEPQTHYWFALKLEGAANRYAIADLFADEAAQSIHFNGQFAAALKAQSAELVVGGWEEGVLKNVTSLTVEAQK